MGVPVQYERNFRAKLEYFRAQCAFHLLSGHAKLSISRDGLLEESFQQVSNNSRKSSTFKLLNLEVVAVEAAVQPRAVLLPCKC